MPYEPGKPVEELQRELGLERVVKLASNEGTFGPFPAALEAIERCARELNRYPDGGAYRLRGALAERHGVRFEEVAPGSGADGVVDCLSQAMLDPGDEIVCGWPSFLELCDRRAEDGRRAEARAAAGPPLRPRGDASQRSGRARRSSTSAYPNNPTGTSNGRAELDAYFAAVPEHVLTVIDQAYFEYVDDPGYRDAVDAYFKAGPQRRSSLRTFSKIYGLAGLRVGYGVGPGDVVQSSARCGARSTSTTQPGGRAREPRRRRGGRARRRTRIAAAMAELARVLERHGLEPVGPAP